MKYVYMYIRQNINFYDKWQSFGSDWNLQYSKAPGTGHHMFKKSCVKLEGLCKWDLDPSDAEWLLVWVWSRLRIERWTIRWIVVVILLDDEDDDDEDFKISMITGSDYNNSGSSVSYMYTSVFNRHVIEFHWMPFTLQSIEADGMEIGEFIRLQPNQRGVWTG